MKKNIIFLWSGLLVVMVFTLLDVTRNVQELEKRIAYLDQEIKNGNNEIKVIDAEWAYLNSPERIYKLTHDHLKHLKYSKLQNIMDMGIFKSAILHEGKGINNNAVASK